jgi:hypothetical protein
MFKMMVTDKMSHLERRPLPWAQSSLQMAALDARIVELTAERCRRMDWTGAALYGKRASTHHLSDIDPKARLANFTFHTAGEVINRMDEVLPWE